MRELLIGICDAELAVGERIKNICSNELELSSMKYKYEITLFEDSGQALSCDRNMDVLILDIEMLNRNGMEVKQYLQNVALGTLVIFITNDTGLVFSAYGLQVFGFVLRN